MSWGDGVPNPFIEAKDKTILEQEQQLTTLREERDVASRGLQSMRLELEAARVARDHALADEKGLNKRDDDDLDKIDALSNRLAAAEARESALREVLGQIQGLSGGDQFGNEIDRIAQAALSAPRDTAALDAMLAKATHDAEVKRLSMAESLTNEIEENRTRKAQLDLVHTPLEGVWKWQGEGDHLDSLVCPVVMTPQTLKDLLARARGEVETRVNSEWADWSSKHDARVRSEAEVRTRHEMMTDNGLVKRAVDEALAAERLKTAALESVYRCADRLGDAMAEFPKDPGAWSEWARALDSAVAKAKALRGEGGT